MILEQNREVVETYGDVQQNKVSIDPRNAEHIISILSSNLYSNPEASFLRETISNAVDSHVEAGTKEPIILLFKAISEYNYEIVIRDYGTGISPERFDSIYRFIGSSTKRTSNDYIGSFGIGRFSALSCADVVYITSYYNGKANYYIMAKNGGGIDIDLISSLNTTEKNGVEIKIQVRDLDSYIEELTGLAYIDNLYVRCDGTEFFTSSQLSKITLFNDRVTVKCNNFTYNSFLSNSTYTYGRRMYEKTFITLGNITYPIDLNKITPLSITFNGYIHTATSAYRLSDVFKDIQPNFEIGSLDVTPNREALMYSERTINALKCKFHAAAQELIDLFIDQTKNETNIFRLYRQCKDLRLRVPINEDTNLDVDLKNLFSNRDLDIVYKGRTLSGNIKETLDYIMLSSLKSLPFSLFALDIKGVLNSIRKEKTSIKDVIFSSGDNFDKLKVVVVGPEESMRSNLLRSYAIYKYNNINSNKTYLFVSKETASLLHVIRDKDFKNFIMRNRYSGGNRLNESEAIWLTKEIYKALRGNIIIDDIENSEEFKTWKENRKSSRSINFTKPEKEIIGYISSDGSYCQRNLKLSFKDLAEFNKELRYYTSMDEEERNRPVIYGELHSPYWDIYESLMGYDFDKRFIYMKTAKNNMKYFRGISDKWIPIEDYIPKSSVFKKYITYRKYKDIISGINSHLTYTLFSFREYFVKEDAKCIERVYRYKVPYFASQHCATLNEILTKFKENKDTYDLSFKHDLEVYAKYVKFAEKLDKAIDTFSNRPLIAYLFMKHKIFRINYTAYENVKNRIKIISQ